MKRLILIAMLIALSSCHKVPEAYDIVKVNVSKVLILIALVSCKKHYKPDDVGHARVTPLRVQI